MKAVSVSLLPRAVEGILVFLIFSKEDFAYNTNIECSTVRGVRGDGVGVATPAHTSTRDAIIKWQRINPVETA